MVNEPNTNTTRKKKSKLLQHWQIISFYLFIYDILAVNASFFLALWLRFDCHFSSIPKGYLYSFYKFTLIYTVIVLITFGIFKLYNSIWRFASYTELLRCILATLITAVIQVAGTVLFIRRMPVSYYIFGTIIQFCLTLGIRFSYRFMILLKGVFKEKANSNCNRVMIIGAGSAGQMLIRDNTGAKKVNDSFCCIIDDNRNKWNRYIDGVPVVGGREDILANVKKYNINKIYLAIPSAPKEEQRNILNICNETDCELKLLPGIYQFINGEVKIANMKKVSVEDLLGRDPIKTNLQEVFSFIKDKTILVTGGGGSIGSELCQQIASHKPKQLIIFDIYENNTYTIQMKLQKKYPYLNLVTLIGSVRDSRRINDVFEEYHPDIVFHAAAHKHVPLMEDNPCESIKNNVIGTYKTAYAAMFNGCSRFVLISTDKAVNPTNIMGASKRLCEMVIQTFNEKISEGKADDLPMIFSHYDNEYVNVEQRHIPTDIKTNFVAVRFGNVLGSNGSVIPIFKRQIEEGGPVTVTHPDIVRYFMTIPEAVSLVLQAGTYAKGGEIFVLDMGDPVKIDTLARNLIKLSGYKPDIDIKIEYTGLRPGEKLYEEKLMDEEGLKKTPNNLIHIGSPIPFDTDRFVENLKDLMDAAYRNDRNIKNLVAELVTTYHPANTNDLFMNLSEDKVYASKH